MTFDILSNADPQDSTALKMSYNLLSQNIIWKEIGNSAISDIRIRLALIINLNPDTSGAVPIYRGTIQLILKIELDNTILNSDDRIYNFKPFPECSTDLDMPNNVNYSFLSNRFNLLNFSNLGGKIFLFYKVFIFTFLKKLIIVFEW